MAHEMRVLQQWNEPKSPLKKRQPLFSIGSQLDSIVCSNDCMEIFTMDSSMTYSPKFQSNSIVAQWFLIFRLATCSLGMLEVFAPNSADAEDTLEPEVQSGANESHSRAVDTLLFTPECVKTLELSGKQREQIEDIARRYDTAIEKVWKEFSGNYMQAIRMESSMLAAIEDNFTEAHREHIREQRRRTAQQEQQSAMRSNPSETTTIPVADGAKNELAQVGITLTRELEELADGVYQRYRIHLRTSNRTIHALHTRLLSLEADKLVAIEKILTDEQRAQVRINRKKAPDSLHQAEEKPTPSKPE